jgi:predicted amidophosphoribosyltransferase
MAETTLEKAVCEKCGADVRENTSFCYNCGHSFTEAVKPANGAEQAEMSVETRTALDDLAAKFKIEESESNDRLALAAAERKKARVAPKKKKEDVWEGSEGRSGGAFIVISLVIFLIVVAVVFVTVYWK